MVYKINIRSAFFKMALHFNVAQYQSTLYESLKPSDCDSTQVAGVSIILLRIEKFQNVINNKNRFLIKKKYYICRYLLSSGILFYKILSCSI